MTKKQEWLKGWKVIMRDTRTSCIAVEFTISIQRKLHALARR